ncbi:MAG: hypothetical protein KDD15_09475, partial [Lewinella sp.]|nr:hypothetical protein [Lewinella sp.]
MKYFLPKQQSGRHLRYWLFLCLLFLFGPLAEAQIVTICSQTAGGYNPSVSNDVGLKLSNLANFGPGGAICDYQFTFVAVGDGFTKATLDANGCMIWWSGYEPDAAYTESEMNELKSWIADGGVVIAGCDSPGYDPVCELLELELSGLPSGGAGVSQINVDLQDSCFPNVMGEDIYNGGGALDAFTEETASQYLVVSRLVSNVNGVSGLNGLATSLFGDGIFATTDVNMFTGVGCCITDGPELTSTNDFFLANAICVLATDADTGVNCIEESVEEGDCTENLICPGQLNVSLQDDCSARLNAASVVGGYDWEYCGVYMTIEDGVDEEAPNGDDDDLKNDGDSDGFNQAVVTGCGTYKYVVTSVSDPNNTCWGYITAEDKKAPVLEYCPSTVSGWSTYDYGFQDFVCDDIEKLLLDGPVTYKLDKDGNLIEGSISTHQAKWLFKYVTGYAEFTDNCGDITVTVEDVVNYGYDKDCDDVVITRKFTAVDACKGLTSPDICYQDIVIRK